MPFRRALLKAQAIGMLIAWLTINKKVNKKPNSIPEETSETQFSFSDYQYLNESRYILYLFTEIKAMKLYKIVSDLLYAFIE